MTVLVERVGERIYLRSARPISGLSKDIPGANYGKRPYPRWSLPLGMDVCTLLREKFGGELEIGPELWQWARNWRADEARARELSGSDIVTLERVPGLFPRLADAIVQDRPYQTIGARWIANGRNTLIGDTVGLGKTVQALAGVIESSVSGPYLVICPKTAVELVWAPEIRHWLPGHEVVTLPEGRAKRDAILNALGAKTTVFGLASLDRTWVVVHPEMVRTQSWWICGLCGSETKLTHKPKVLVCEHDPRKTKTRHDHEFPQLFSTEWGVIIADESDKSVLRSTGTPTLTRRGMELLRDDCVREEGLRLAQSGTPFRSRPHLLWSTLNWLRPDEYPAYWRWAEMYFEIEEGYGGSRKVGRLRPDREAMLYRDLDRIMLRRTRQEVAKYLPKKMYIGTHLIPGDEDSPVAVWMPMEPAQDRAYQQMLKTSSAIIEGGTVNAVGILAELTRLKQFATSAGKIEMITKMVKYREVDPVTHEIGEWAREEPTARQRKEGKPGKFKRREELVPVFRPAFPSNKFAYILQMLTELGYPDDPQGKVIIVSQFTATLELFGEALADRFGVGSVGYVTGSVTGKARKAIVDAFEQPIGEPGPLIMMLNTKAGGSAITLDQADDMILLDQTWIPDDQEQAEGRNDNRRPEEKILQRRYHYLMSQGTVEVGIALTNAERSSNGQMILDGRRGVQWGRDVLKASK